MIHCIVVGYHKWREVEALVGQLASLEMDDVWIHFADNLGDSEIIKRVKVYPNVTYYSFRNIGFGNAANHILRSNQWPEDSLFVIMNDDILFKGNGFGHLVNTYNKISERQDNVGVVSPSFVASRSSEDSSRYFQLSKFNQGIYTEMIFGPAACWMVNYTFLKKVGGFYPGFFMYGEDLELLNRASYYGFKHYLVHDSLVLHDFDYPPKDESLRLMKETNLIAAHYLDLNSRWKGHVFATKGLIVSFSRVQFTRFKFIFLGYIQFFLKSATLRRAKMNHKSPQDFRYIQPLSSNI